MAFKGTAGVGIPRAAQVAPLTGVECWSDDGVNVKRPAHLDYDIDYLAWVLMQISEGRPPYEIYHDLEYFNEDKILSKTKKEVRAFEPEADTIRRHFKSKHLMRSLRNQELSDWMRKVDEIIENPRRHVLENSRVLAKLPHFYNENKIVDEVFKNAESAGDPRTTSVVDEFELVSVYDRNAVDEKEFRMLFQNGNRQVLILVAKVGERSTPLLKALAKPGMKIRFGGIVTVFRPAGQEISAFHPTKDHDIEIHDK